MELRVIAPGESWDILGNWVQHVEAWEFAIVDHNLKATEMISRVRTAQSGIPSRSWALTKASEAAKARAETKKRMMTGVMLGLDLFIGSK